MVGKDGVEMDAEDKRPVNNVCIISHMTTFLIIRREERTDLTS